MGTPQEGASSTGPAHPGDIGRRVAQRRRELGLTREEAAARGGLAPGYFEYVETHPAVLQADALTRLADTLRTSVSYLLGADAGLPPGIAGAKSAHTALEELPAGECWERLSAAGIGRVVLSTPVGPEAVPVNFRTFENEVVYRTAAGGVLAKVGGEPVALEVDSIDYALGEGWSVLLSGTAELIDDPGTVRRLEEEANPHPWAGGSRNVWVRIHVTRISGRATHARGAPPSL